MSPLPDDVQKVARAMLNDIDTIMADVTARVWVQVPAYADVLVQKEDLGDRVRENLIYVITCLLEDRRPADEELGHARENGERRALQGVSQAAIIQSFRNTERTVSDVFNAWCVDMKVPANRTRAGQRELIQHFDEIEGAMVDAFLAMQRQISTKNVLSEPDLMNRLVSGQPIAVEELEHLAGALQIRDVSTTRFVGACAVLTRISDERQLVQVRHQLVSHLHGVTGQPVLSGTVLTDSGLRAAVFTLPWMDDVDMLATILTSAITVQQLGVPVLAGVGDSSLGLSQAGNSCRQAISAVEVGRTRGLDSTTVIYSDVLLEVLAMGDHVVMRQLHDRYIRPLAAYEFLEETLRCFLGTNQSIAKAALQLRVHKNTVVYRIRRIQELTGLDLHEMRDVTRAVLALECGDLGIVDR